MHGVALEAEHACTGHETAQSHKHGCLNVNRHLWIDAMLLCGAVLALGLGVAERRPVFGSPGVHVDAILVHELDDFHAPVNCPEERQVVAGVDVVGIRTCPEKRFTALIAAPAWQSASLSVSRMHCCFLLYYSAQSFRCI